MISKNVENIGKTKKMLWFFNVFQIYNTNLLRKVNDKGDTLL